VQFIGVSQDDVRTTREFRERFGITFPTLLDESRRYPASNAFGISSVPSLFLVEVDGTISMAFHGFSKPDLELVGERAGVPPFTPEDHVPDWKPG
jgi:peroxiredoxin